MGASAEPASVPVRARGRRLAPAGPPRTPLSRLRGAAGAVPRPWDGPLHVADAGTIIGREAELARLLDLWRTHADTRQVRAVLIAGEPGAGKTRLAAELAGVVDAAGGRVLVGRCRPDTPSPYEPFIEALTPALAECSPAWLDDHVARHSAGLARLFPGLESRLGHAPRDLDVKPRPRLLVGLAAAVTELGPERVLLVLEDLHWATPTTVLALDHLLRRSASASGLLVVGTYRDAAVHAGHALAPFLGDVSAPAPERLVLGNLSAHAVAALLVDRAAVAGAPAAALARSLWTATEGNPLVVTEAVRDLIVGGALAGGSIKAKTVESVRIARNVAGVVSHRLRRVPAAVRAALEAAAVIGAAFDVADVALLCDEREDETRDLLRTAVGVAVIVPVDGRPDRYAFLHDAARDAILDGVSPNRLVRLHHMRAEGLERPERRPTASPAVLVHHCAAAAPVGRSPEAMRHARRAGEEALGMLAYEEAAGYFGQALAFVGLSGDSANRVDLLTLLGDAYQRAGEASRARHSYLQAAAGSHVAGDGARMGRAVLGLGDVMGVWGDDRLLIGLLEQALELTGDDPSLRAKLLARLTQARAGSFDTDERKAQSDEAWELAWDSRDADTMGAVLRARHESLSAPDDLEDRVEMDGELFAMANNAQDTEVLLLAHGWRFVDILEQGHAVDADRDRKLHAALAKKSGDARHKRDAELWAAAWALLEGRSRRAGPHIDKALALGQRVRSADASSYYWLQQFAVLDDWGTLADLDELIDVWHDLIRTHDRGPLWWSSLALLYLRAGRRDDAAVALDDLLHDGCADIPLDRDWLPTVAAIVEVAAALQDERAPAAGRLLSTYTRRLVVVGPGLACRGSVARVTGMAAAAGGNWPTAERHFQAALAAHERIGAAPLVARTRSDFGRALARKRGGALHTGRVEQMLAEAVEEAERLGMNRLAADTQSATPATSRCPSPRSPTSWPR